MIADPVHHAQRDPDESPLKEYGGNTAPAVLSILFRQMTLAITIFFETIIEHMMRKVNKNASYRDLSIILIFLRVLQCYFMQNEQSKALYSYEKASLK